MVMENKEVTKLALFLKFQEIVYHELPEKEEEEWV